MRIRIPSPFPPPRILPIVAGTTLHRIHDRQFGSTEFNPGRGARTRFAPLAGAPGGAIIPTLYAADSFDCAVYESILHDVPIGPAPTTIGWHRLAPADYSELVLKRPILLAQLNEPDLKRMGTCRSELLDCGPRHYKSTAAWALALISEHEHVQGFCWTSSKDDSATCYILFGNRLSDPEEYFETSNPRAVHESRDLLDRVTIASSRIGCAFGW